MQAKSSLAVAIAAILWGGTVQASTPVVSCTEVGEGVYYGFSLERDETYLKLTATIRWAQFDFLAGFRGLSRINSVDVSRIEVSMPISGCTLSHVDARVMSCYNVDGLPILATLTHGREGTAAATRESVSLGYLGIEVRRNDVLSAFDDQTERQYSLTVNEQSDISGAPSLVDSTAFRGEYCL